jgi:hypothetical protein
MIDPWQVCRPLKPWEKDDCSVWEGQPPKTLFGDKRKNRWFLFIVSCKVTYYDIPTVTPIYVE